MKTYCKELSKTDIGVRLSFPMKSFKEALPEMGASKLPLDFKAIDNSNSQKQWEFRLSTRKLGGHPKPVLSAGWRQYVRAKGLKKGDRIILYLDKDEAGKKGFRIRAQRKVAFKPVKLFGTELKEKGEYWTDVENLKSGSA